MGELVQSSGEVSHFSDPEQPDLIGIKMDADHHAAIGCGERRTDDVPIGEDDSRHIYAAVRPGRGDDMMLSSSPCIARLKS